MGRRCCPAHPRIGRRRPWVVARSVLGGGGNCHPGCFRTPREGATRPGTGGGILGIFMPDWASLRQRMAETIFSKILRGEIPCHKVYEDDRVLAFLDVGPLSFGHTLVIPKEAAATLDELSDESAAAIGR